MKIGPLWQIADLNYVCAAGRDPIDRGDVVFVTEVTLPGGTNNHVYCKRHALQYAEAFATCAGSQTAVCSCAIHQTVIIGGSVQHRTFDVDPVCPRHGKEKK